MKNNLVINVDTDKNLANLNDGDLLVYNASKKCYYVTTREKFMYEQNVKIENLEKKVNEFINNITKEVYNFEKNTNDKFNDFLTTYKETNAKMIEMIKALMEDK